MSTFSEFIVKAQRVVDDNNTRTAPYLKECTVRWLQKLSRQRVLFMEGTFQFNTTANQSEYTTGYTNFPVDVSEIHALYTTDGDMISGPSPLAALREVNISTVLSAAWTPLEWGWHHSSLILAPTPTSVVTIKGDYQKDGTRDTASGAVITDTSTTHTNPWFSTGEDILLNAVLWDYFSAIAKDAEAASMAKTRFQEGLADAVKAQTTLAGKGAQPVFYF